MNNKTFIYILLALIPVWFSCRNSDQGIKEAGHTPLEEHQADAQEDVTAHSHENDVIQVDKDWEELVGLKTELVVLGSIEETVAVPGKIIPNADKIASVGSMIEATVNCVFKNVGDRVEKGEALVCLVSPALGSLRAEYDKAKAELEITGKNYTRREKLFQENIISERVFQQDRKDFQVAQVNYQYARKRLLAVGVAEEEIDNPPTGHSEAEGATIHLHAPISGIITLRAATIGQRIGPEDQLFEIIDLGTVWLEADIFEKDLSTVASSNLVRAHVAAYPDDLFSGRIFYLGSTLDQSTKTVKLLASINNRDERLKPGMYATTEVVVGRKTSTLLVPASAVLEDEQLQVVYVKEEEGYHRHVIGTGIRSGNMVEVTSVLKEGDEVVTSGNYQLKSKSRMQGVDPHAGHVH